MRVTGGFSVVALLAALVVGMPNAHAAAPKWKPIQAPGAAKTSTGNHLNAVDCWSRGNCVAVGYHNQSSAVGSFIDQERKGKWRYVNQPFPSRLTSVSCPAAGQCVAIGTIGFAPSNTAGQLLVQSGKRWKAINVSDLYKSSYTSALTGIDCPKPGSCEAVGQSYTSQEVSTGFILTLKPGKNPTKAKSWNAITAPESAAMKAHEDASLNSVSCVSPGNCRAVGFAHADDNVSDDVPLIDEEKNDKWAFGGSPGPSGAYSAQLTSVACVKKSTVCMASGDYSTNASGQLPFIATIDTKTDKSEATPEGLGAPFTSGELQATSCAPDAQCQAVGLEYSTGGKTPGWNGFIVSVKYGGGKAEASAAVTKPPKDVNPVGQNETLTSTSCASGGVCISVGSYVSKDGPQQDNDNAVIVTRTYSKGGKITGETDIKAPEPRNDKISDDQSPLNDVMCSNKTHCLAVGSYFNDDETKSRGVIDSLGGPASKTHKK